MFKHALKNKRAFTLLEVMIAVAMFSIVTLMTFTVINSYPKLVRTETKQFGERTNVRTALVSISNTIRQSKSVAVSGSTYEFKQGNDDIITFSFSNNQVRKIVNRAGTISSSVLLDSLENFSITSVDNGYFTVRMKTKTEAKDYEYTVTRINDATTKLNAISTLSKYLIDYDKTSGQNAEAVTLYLNGNVFNNEISYNGVNLVIDTDFHIDSSGNYVINAGFLANKSGVIELTFNVGLGEDPVLKIDITQSTSNKLVVAASDNHVTMQYPNNKYVTSYDNSWTITVTNGTVKNNVNASNIEIQELPQDLPLGLNIKSVSKGIGNTIVIVVDGTAATAITETANVTLKVLRSAVTEELTRLDSNNITVELKEGTGIPTAPEYNIIYTGIFTINQNVNITGDIFLGGSREVKINNNSTIKGNIYINNNLTVEQNAQLGSADDHYVVLVNGGINFENNSKIYDDVFYEDYYNKQQNAEVYGEVKKMTVPFPTVVMPTAYDDDWYANNGYTVISSQNTDVDLVTDGKYYFTIEYSIKRSFTNVQNIRIAAKSNLIFENNLTGSGVIYAPAGRINLKQGVNFTGIMISQETQLDQGGTFKYQNFPNLPYQQP